MKLKVDNTKHSFRGVRIFNTDVFTDFRGDLWTTWKKDTFPPSMHPQIEFNHDKISVSRKHVLRGIHGDNKAWKLVTCVLGEIYFVLLDNRENSDTFTEWSSMILDDKSRQMVLIPPGVGNGFLVMSDQCVFNYKWAYKGKYPDVEDQFTIKWNDPLFNIFWPIDNPILQERDK